MEDTTKSWEKAVLQIFVGSGVEAVLKAELNHDETLLWNFANGKKI